VLLDNDEYRLIMDKIVIEVEDRKMGEMEMMD